MKLSRQQWRYARARAGAEARRGAVLMLAMMVLFVLLLIVFQISISTGTDARVSRNEEVLKAMDLSIESFLTRSYETLIEDGDADAEGDAGGGMGGADPMAGMGGGGGDAPAAQAPCDSREDGWAKVETGSPNGLDLRVLIQDEDSKFNLLTLLAENEDEAKKAFDRLARVIEYSRAGTEAEIDGTEASRMAHAMLEYMNRRRDQLLPKTDLLSDDDEKEDWGLPLSLRELVAADPEVFKPDHFRDFEDESGKVVHSLGSFITVWTSLTTSGGGGGGGGGAAAGAAAGGAGIADPAAGAGAGTTDPTGGAGATDGGSTLQTDAGGGAVPGAGGAGAGGLPAAGATSGGVAVNVNTAPLAVLRALLEDRDVPYGWWEAVMEYRNTIDEAAAEAAGDEEYTELNEVGEDVGPFQVFDTFEKLQDVDGWYEIEPLFQGELNNLLTTKSSVFSIFVTARKQGNEEDQVQARSEAERRELERKAGGLVRTVRCVVWRRTGAEGTTELVPLVRWEVLDYQPIPVLDYPEDDDR